MDITPQQLNQPEYTMLDRLDHKELIPFVNLYLKKGTFSTRLYYVFNFISLALLLIFFGMAFLQDQLSISDTLTHLCYGFAIAFMLVPLHEWIHALAYKWVGAANTSYDANWKKFYFMAMSDQFVVSKREFRVVALAPILTISAFLLLLSFLLPTIWIFTLLGVYVTHTAFCSGYFGLLSYFDFHGDKEVYTYDDKAEKVSYFYARHSNV